MKLVYKTFVWCVAAFALNAFFCASARATNAIEPSTILEPSPTLTADLGWETSADSLQARLFDALSGAEPSTGVSRTESKGYVIQDKGNRIFCEAGQTGLLQVVSYRCDLKLAARLLDWSTDESSAQGVLFRSLIKLREASNDRVTTLTTTESADSALVRLVDDDSASKIVCESKTTKQPTPSSPATHEYRCLFDLRP